MDINRVLIFRQRRGGTSAPTHARRGAKTGAL